MRNVDIINGNLKKSLIQMAFPLMILNVFNSLYGLVDTFFVGKIGELAVGAISLVTPVLWCALSIANGLAAGCTAIVSFRYGAQEYDKASSYSWQILYISLIFILILTISTFVCSDWILVYLKAPVEIYKDSFNYLRILSFDYLGLFLITIYMAIMQSCGNSKSGMIVSAMASIFNIILDPLLIFGFSLSVKGAAIATVISKWIVIPYILYSLFHHPQLKPYFHIHLKDSFEILKLSLPCAIGQFLESLGFVLMNKYIIYYGAVAMSGYGIGEKLTNLYNIPVIAFSNVLPAFIGQNLGAEKKERARQSYRYTMWITTILSFALLFIGIAWMKPSILLFVPDASSSLLSITSTFVFFTLLTGPFCTWYFNLCAVFNGSGHTFISFLLSILRLWGTRIPLILLFFQYTDLGIMGIWISMLLSNIITGCIAQILYWIYPWTKK